MSSCRCGGRSSDICLVVHCYQFARIANELGCLCRVWRRCCSAHNSSPQSRIMSTRGGGSTAMTGAEFEISIDGTPRSYRDRKDYAMEAAQFLKSRNPNSVVKLKDL